MVDCQSLPWEIEGYHGAEVYVRRYYLLCLAYALQQSKNDWQPPIPHFTKAIQDQDDDYILAKIQELRVTYTFLINLPYRVDKVLEEYDNVVSISEEWSDVFDSGISDALKKARTWLEDPTRRQEWKEKAESIIKDISLDNRRVKAYRKAAIEYYEAESQALQLATSGNVVEKAATELRRGCRLICPDKRVFTPIGLEEPQEIARRVGFEAVGQIVMAEVAYIANIILEHGQIKPIGVEKLTFDEVKRAAMKINEAGHEATVLLAPGQRISSAWRNDLDFRTRMTYEEGNERYLNLDESTKLRILELNDDYAFVLDKRAGNWAVVEPLEIEVAECDKNPLKVQISAQEVINYQILHPEAVRILEFRSPRKKESETQDGRAITSKLLNWYGRFKKLF